MKPALSPGLAWFLHLPNGWMMAIWSGSGEHEVGDISRRFSEQHEVG